MAMLGLVFIAWLVAEIAAAFAVAHAIGVLWCVLALLAGWPLGSMLVRAEGRAALRHLREALAAGRAPGAEVADGALAVLGGGLLIVPGFVTDALGLALLVPAIRRFAARWLARHAHGRVVARAAGVANGARRPYDVDSTARDAEPPTLRG